MHSHDVPYQSGRDTVFLVSPHLVPNTTSAEITPQLESVFPTARRGGGGDGCQVGATLAVAHARWYGEEGRVPPNASGLAVPTVRLSFFTDPCAKLSLSPVRELTVIYIHKRNSLHE